MPRNCWEMMHCGRGPGGQQVAEKGLCPAASQSAYTGVNHGRAAGRVCWAVAGTLCGGQVAGTFAEKRLTCLGCQVFKTVHKEEGARFELRPRRLLRLLVG